MAPFIWDDKKYTPQQIMNRVYNKDWHFIYTADVWLQVALGEIPWAGFINKFWIASVNTAEKAVWDWANWYVFPTSAQILDVTSDDAEDNSAGAWARTMFIQGLDENYNAIEEVITLLPWTTNTINSYLRVYRMIIMTAWSNWTNIWTIEAKQWANIVARIGEWVWQTLMAIYTVPAWKTWYMTYGKMSTWKGFEVTIRMKARMLWWAFQTKHQAYCYQGTYDYRFTVPLQIPEKTDIIVTAEADLANANVSAVFDLILLDN